jgi:16S rRNA (cytosine967-C5)-methyltransferase
VILQELTPAIIDTLRVVFWQNVYATKAIEQTLKLHPDWEDSKRAIFSDTIYDLIRWWRPLWFIIDKEPSENPEDLQKLITIYLFTKKGDLTALQNKKDLDTSQLFQRIQSMKHSLCASQSPIGWMPEEKKNWACAGSRSLSH